MSFTKKQLQDLKIGNSIAELDELLSESYVESSIFYEFIDDRYDIIRGAKGTGKSALLLYVLSNHSSIEKIDDVRLIKANEHEGDPSFKRAFSVAGNSDGFDIFTEAWKIYIINLVWPEIRMTLDGTEEIDAYLRQKNILTMETSLFKKFAHSFRTARHSIVMNDVEYGFQLEDSGNDAKVVDYNHIFRSMNCLLHRNEMRAWVLLDRLDDAFPDWTDTSQKALKSLFNVYKELLGYKNLKLKTFIRSDIYDRITIDGFTSLSHIGAISSTPIEWDESGIMKFVAKRFSILIESHDVEHILACILGDQIDVGKKKPDSFHWMLNHLTDGNSRYTPRDILNYLENARTYTIREMEQLGINPDSLFSKSSLKEAWKTVSANKIQTQLFAENPELRPAIEKFRGGKSEYSNEKLEELLGHEYKAICEHLNYVGFLGKYGPSWKIPFLYRPYLSIKQGKA